MVQPLNLVARTRLMFGAQRSKTVARSKYGDLAATGAESVESDAEASDRVPACDAWVHPLLGRYRAGN
jgi:hypothetical protein